jgi:uncharacterized protein RhaS with RHS repeats
MGNYLSQDPIGLEGNNPTLYGYVMDANSWVDVLGLKGAVTAVLSVGNKTYTAINQAIDLPNGEFKDIVDLAKDELAVMNDIKPFYGNCAEINAIQKALDDGVSLNDLNGSTIKVTKTRTNQIEPPCNCCRKVLAKLGIKCS